MTEHFDKLRLLAVTSIAAYQGVRAIRYWVLVVGDYVVCVWWPSVFFDDQLSRSRFSLSLMLWRIPAYYPSRNVSHHNCLLPVHATQT